jgi:enamine deaminase RidA (YjgF/YER057c/UK114 family)
VAGTTATTPDGPVGGTDLIAQTKESLRRIQVALEEAGASIDDVVRTRIFLSDIDRWEEVGQIHAEFFADVQPTNTMIGAALPPQLLVQIDVDAVISDS